MMSSRFPEEKLLLYLSFMGISHNWPKPLLDGEAEKREG